MQYADYALWQRELLGDEDDPGSLLAGQVAYWRQALAGAPEELALPADRPRPAVPSYRGHAVPLEVPADVHERLAGLAREQGVTVVHGGAGRAGGAAVPAGRGDGHPGRVAGRGADRRGAWTTWSGSSSTPWCCAPTCPGIRRSRELLGRVREAGLGALEHQDVPFERLVEVLAPARSLARHPLFQVMLAVQNNAPAGAGPARAAGQRCCRPVRRAARFDLDVALAEVFDGRAAGRAAAGR